MNPLKAILAIAPGLNPVRAAREIWHDGKEMAKHGAHEIAAALFSGQGFVMYPRADRENQQQKTQERGGLER